MNHDVFISYSSQRPEVANEICDLLEKSGLKCWIAPRDIVGDNFDDQICDAIVACRLFVVVFSKGYSVSTWCKAELNLAFSEGKAILPYRIDNTPLRGGFRLKLQNSHCLESCDDYRSEFPKLVQMATQIVGVPAPQPVPEPQPSEKTYNIGDLYDDGTKKGVVFEVTPDGKHGKMVSLEKAQKKWAMEAVCVDMTGAISMSDGKANMREIMAISGWREKYRAFAWCADLGEGWYLPTRDELKAISKARDIINATLSANGCTKLNGDWHWSSSEYDPYEFCAWRVYMGNGETTSGCKFNYEYVRAVSAF